jgi:hypothetical protein
MLHVLIVSWHRVQICVEERIAYSMNIIKMQATAICPRGINPNVGTHVTYLMVPAMSVGSLHDPLLVPNAQPLYAATPPPDISNPGCTASDQGLTLVHFSAQPEPLLSQNTP